MLVLVAPSYALNNENIKWSEEGNTYKLTQTDNMFTDKEYTIKVIEFPFAVRGYKTIDGSVHTERPVTPFVKFELYRDIINNPNPIDTFAIGVGEEYITPDQEMKITINDIPGSTSQDWVYEYYNPWVIIKAQKRLIPNLDIAINLRYASGDAIDDANIKPGDSIDAEIRIKNVGNDVLEDINFDIDHGQLMLDDVGATSKLKDTVYQLVKDEEKVVNFRLIVPLSLEQKVYEIRVNANGHDVKDVMYSFSASRIINTKSDIEAMYVEKSVSRNTSYLKEYVGVTLNIVNTGHVAINNVQLHDAIPDRLIVIKNGAIQNYKEFSLNKSSIGPSESWTIEYSLKAEEPGIYILPQFDVSFSVGEKNISATSSEVGFRVFGPYVILDKSATDMGNGIVEVIVKAKNVGNGPTRAIIEDQLPNNTALILGEMNLAMSLNPDSEKVMSYTIRAQDTNISNLIWPPAKATYYLDDWRLNTSSDEKYQEGHKIEEGYQLKGGTGAHVIVSTLVASSPTGSGIYPEITLPKIEEEEQKKVVATIPARTPAKIPEKSTPGFVSYELIFLLMIPILLKRTSVKK